jgi:hypothetical protein
VLPLDDELQFRVATPIDDLEPEAYPSDEDLDRLLDELDEEGDEDPDGSEGRAVALFAVLVVAALVSRRALPRF